MTEKQLFNSGLDVCPLNAKVQHLLAVNKQCSEIIMQVSYINCILCFYVYESCAVLARNQNPYFSVLREKREWLSGTANKKRRACSGRV